MINAKDSTSLSSGENFTFNIVLGGTRLVNEPRYETNHALHGLHIPSLHDKSQGHQKFPPESLLFTV